MSDPLALLGTTIDDYRIQRKRRSFDPYSDSWEAIHEGSRETCWLLAFHPLVSQREDLSELVQEEWLRLQRVEHTFWMNCGDHLHHPETQQLFVVYEPFARAQQLSELQGKLRPGQVRKLFYFLVDVLTTAHHHGICGWLDPRHLYVRRKGDEVDLRWYRTPSQYMQHMPDSVKATDENEWISYQSPEFLAGETATPSSDWFSLGTILYETITGKRAFFHRSANKVKEKILSGDFPNLAKTKLTMEQGQLIASLWDMNPETRFTQVKSFQSQIRSLFSDQSPFAADYMPTDEHPALLIKESQPPFEADSPNHISITGSFASHAVISHEAADDEHVTSNDHEEFIEYLEPPEPPSQPAQPIQQHAENMDAVVEQEEQAEYEHDSFEAAHRNTSDTEIVKAVTAVESSKPIETVRSSKDNLSNTEAESWHSKAVIQHHKRLNTRNIHPLGVQVVSSEAYEPSENDWNAKPQSQSPFVRIVPVLPGCLVSPQEAVVDIRAPHVEAKFWVVPLAPVNISDAAKVQLWHGGLPKDEIPIPCEIRSQFLTKIAGAASLASFVAGAAFVPTSSVAKEPNLASQLFHQTVTLFASYGYWFGFFFLATAIMSYYWLRPEAGSPITYLLSDELPHPTSFQTNDS